jgi:antitoxin YefM
LPTPDAVALPKWSTLITLTIEKSSSLYANTTMISVILSLELAFKGTMLLYGDRYFMDNVPLSQASSNLDRLIETTATTHQPVLIVGNHNAVLVSEQDWNAIQETLYLLSMPGMRESIHEGMNTPVEDCDEELTW